MGDERFRAILNAANDNLPEEVWRQVPSIPEIEASSHGRIRRKPHIGRMPHGGERLYKSGARFGQITKATKDARHLYFGMVYYGIGNIKVHFAVCEAFHGPDPSGKNRVRHLNENGLDNRPENLVWDQQKINMNDPILKNYQRRRVYPKTKAGLTKVEKRAGVYDNIVDFAQRHLARVRAIAANDNKALHEIDRFVAMNELRLNRLEEFRTTTAKKESRTFIRMKSTKHPAARTIDNIERDRDILIRHQNGERHPAIAKIFGISRERVRQIVKSAGGTPRRKVLRNS